MKVNIITVNSGWILQKISERIELAGNNLGHEFKVSYEIDYSADVNYYIDFSNCYHGQKTRCDVAFFTHICQSPQEWVRNDFIPINGFELSGIVSMNKRYTDMLVSIGYPQEKTITLVPGEVINNFNIKKTKIGIVSRGTYHHYGASFMKNFFDACELQNEFQFLFLGKDWDEIVNFGISKNYEINYIIDEDYSNYPEFYQNIDYLLIPALYTAGPLCMQEALACGVPIIASNVGFINYEFKADYVFEPGDVNQLLNILINIHSLKANRRKQVEHLNWISYTSQLIEFFERAILLS